MNECTCGQPPTNPVTVCPIHPHAWKRGKAVGREVSEDELPEFLRRKRANGVEPLERSGEDVSSGAASVNDTPEDAKTHE